MKNKLLAGLLFLFVSYLSYGQSLNVSLSPQNPTLCSGAQTVLSTTVSGGTAPYTYLWSTGETSSAISANKAINYNVTVTDRNGNKGTAQVTVTAITRPDAPTAVNSAIVVCPGSPARLEVANPLTNATYHWYDATGNVLTGTGPVFNTAPISQNTTFFVDATASGCTSERSAIVVVLRDPPTVNRVSVCAGSPAVFTANGADSYIWYDAAGTIVQSGGNTFTTGALTTGTSFYVTGTTNGCTSVKVEARADVKPKTPNPNGGGPYAVCNGSNITLSASGVNGAIYEWFDQPTGGVPIISSPDFTTPILTQNTTYYVQATIDGCPSDRIAVNITVSQPPSLPTASSNSPACYNSPAQLTVTNPEGGVIYRWYTSATSTQIYRTGISVTTDPLVTNTTFYVRAERGACLGDAVAVPVTVNSAVVAPTVTGATVTCPGTTTLTATAPAGTLFNWYNSSTGGTPVFTGNVFNAPATSSRSYFVSVTNPGGCESARTQVDITVTAPPAAPVGTDGRACIGSSATLRATGAINYLWYENQTGGVPVGTGATFVTPVITATTNYFVSAVDASGCESSTRTRVRAIVVTTPAMPTVSGTSTICEGTSATLTASGSTGSYEWWTDEFNGVRLATTATFNTGNLSTNTTFWVQAVTPEGCASPRRSRDVTVTSRVSPQFQYSSGTYCTTSPATTPTAFVPGTFSASPGGLTISASNGRITPATSVPGNYTITFTPSGGACNTPTNAKIVITAAPVATFHYPNAEYCNIGSATPVFAFGASAGTFSASPAGLVFRDATAGEINLTNSTPGTYTITNTINTTCGNTSATFNITINRGVVVNAGSDITLQAGNTVQLNGTVSIPGLGVTWTSSNSADRFSNANSLTTDYTPAATSGTTTLTLTTADPDPSGPCDARSNTLIVKIISKPPTPTVADQTICYNTKATLTATAPGGTYKWYDQPAGGTLLFTGNPYITANLTAGTNIYVTATVNGLESDRKMVSITVNPDIAEPTVTGAGAVCPGKITLTVNEIADAYEWRDSNGNLKSTSKVFEPTISQNTTYVVRIRVGNCFSPAHQVSLTTNPTATVNSASTGQVCSGSAQNYTITSATNNATFTYSRAQKAGISEAAVANVASSQITEILTNTTNNEINVTYIITPYLNGCAGAPFNYTVTVLPTPVITSANSKTACNKAPLNYLVQMSPSITNYFSWSRAAVPGISNAAISGQASMNIRESLINTTKAPVDVVYTFNYGTTSCPGAPFNLTVTVNPDVTITSSDFIFACSGSPVDYQITSDVTGATFRWQRLTALPGQPAHTTLTTSSTINEVLTNNSTQQVFVDYFVIPQFNGCDGTPLSLRVILAPAIPKPHVNSNTPVCIEKTIILNSDITGDKYIWTSSSGFLQETTVPYINIPATASGTFKYRVEVKRGNCSNTSDYFTIEVYQKPVANAGGDRTVCYDATSVPLNGQVNGHVDGRPIGGIWDIVTGTGSFSANPNILANSYIPTQADRDAGTVVLSLTSLDASDCARDVKLITITFDRVGPADTQADRIKEICAGGQITYDIVTTADGSAGLTYSWTRNAVGGNPAGSGTTKTITQTLVNNTTADIVITYTITPSLNGCAGEPFTLNVTVKPSLPKKAFTPTLAAVCINKPIELVYPDDIPGATYVWTGPNGLTGPANSRTWTIANGLSTSGSATFNLTIKVGTCEVVSDPVTVEVRPTPVVTAENDRSVCPDDLVIQLNGTVTSGTNGPALPGRWEIVLGNGQLTNASQTNATYQPTAAERTPGRIVVLKLVSAGNDNCDVVTDEVTYTFQKIRAANAGPDRDVCEQSFELNGQILVTGATGNWDGGTGTFVDGRNSLNGTYIPSQAERNAGFVTLTLTAIGAGPCDEAGDEVTFKLLPPPTVQADAGTVRYGQKGKTITLNPIVSDANVTYQWTETPSVGSISNPNVKNPVITVADVDVTYKLIVTAASGCVGAEATVLVISSPEISAPNTFTPNADGYNDVWLIAGMEAYPGAIVDIFDRTGRPIYHSIGYAKPWDGTSNGKPVPFGTYYFVINTRDGEQQKLTGYVTVVR